MAPRYPVNEYQRRKQEFRRRSRRGYTKSSERLGFAFVTIVFGILGLALVSEFGPPLVGCSVKGNISAVGERIFHVPGQEYYWKTRINLLAGERWFCTEEAARAAGWRRSKV